MCFFVSLIHLHNNFMKKKNKIYFNHKIENTWNVYNSCNICWSGHTNEKMSIFRWCCYCRLNMYNRQENEFSEIFHSNREYRMQLLQCIIIYFKQQQQQISYGIHVEIIGSEKRKVLFVSVYQITFVYSLLCHW